MCKLRIIESTKKMIALSKTFKSVNFQDYFIRKINYDLERNKYDKFTSEELNEEVEKLERIILVQNLYTDLVKAERQIQIQKCGV